MLAIQLLRHVIHVCQLGTIRCLVVQNVNFVSIYFSFCFCSSLFVCFEVVCVLVLFISCALCYLQIYFVGWNIGSIYRVSQKNVDVFKKKL